MTCVSFSFRLMGNLCPTRVFWFSASKAERNTARSFWETRPLNGHALINHKGIKATVHAEVIAHQCPELIRLSLLWQGGKSLDEMVGLLLFTPVVPLPLIW